MRSLFTTSPVLLLLLASIANATILFTQPEPGTTWKAGETVTIKWISAPGTPRTSARLLFELLSGDSKSPVLVAPNIATARESAGQVNYTVNATLPTGNQYTLRANGVYSVVFTILNSRGGAGNATNPVNGTTGGNGTAATPTTSDSKTAATTTTPSNTPSASAKSDASRVASTGALLVACGALVSMF